MVKRFEIALLGLVADSERKICSFPHFLSLELDSEIKLLSTSLNSVSKHSMKTLPSLSVLFFIFAHVYFQRKQTLQVTFKGLFPMQFVYRFSFSLGLCCKLYFSAKLEGRKNRSFFIRVKKVDTISRKVVLVHE